MNNLTTKERKRLITKARNYALKYDYVHNPEGLMGLMVDFHLKILNTKPPVPSCGVNHDCSHTMSRRSGDGYDD